MFDRLRAGFNTPLPTNTGAGIGYASAGNSPTQFVKPEQVWSEHFNPDRGGVANMNPESEVFAGVSATWSTQFAGSQPSVFDPRQPIIADNTAYATPAAGSQNLNAPLERSGGQVTGRQPTFIPNGPVNAASANWSGLAGVIPVTTEVSYAGPVGQSKYSDQVAMALAQANKQTINDAMIAAGLVAAV